LDEGLPFRSAAYLRSQGQDVIHVREAGLASATDPEILEFAGKQDRTCITLDHGFHMLLADSGATRPSVIFIRERKLNYLDASRLITQIVAQLGLKLNDGLAVTATHRSVRLRQLPLKVR
jgi:predicted nuclease of predicted toxin-antitoxin system